MITFISYCHQDEPWFDKIRLHIAPLLRKGEISIWSDHRILAGQPLGSEIESNMASAELFLLILSPAYFASDYCMNVELAHAISRYESDSAKIIPVIVEPCKWDSIPKLRDLKIIPKDAKPVNLWSNQNSALVEVVDEIERLVKIESEKRVIHNSADQYASTSVNKISVLGSNQKIQKSMATHELMKKLNQGHRNFSGLHIKELDLVDYSLQKIDFSDSDLSGAKLEGSNLEGANFVNSTLKGADLYLTKLNGANLSAANFEQVNLVGANLSFANLWQCNLKNSQLEGAVLEGTILSGATLMNANLSNSNLKCTTLWYTELISANLLNTNLSLANLAFAELENINLENAKLQCANIINAGLKGAQLPNADLRFANLQNSDLEDANLQGADLSYANLMNANTKNAKFEGTNQTGTIK